MKKDRSDLLGNLLNNNVVALTANMLAKGSYIHPTKQVITDIRRELRIDHPWIHFRPDVDTAIMDSKCSLHRRLFFTMQEQGRGFVPTECLECWKIVVRPRTVVQLFNLHDLMAELNFHSKCGFEDRETVCGNYGGYFYNKSKEEGLSRREVVVKEIKREVGDIPVFLKRFCTEYEHALCPGKTSTYEQPKWAKDFEEVFYSTYEVPEESVEQPEFLKKYIKLRWITKAWAMGDKTAEQLNKGFPLYPGVQTYNYGKE